RLAAHRTGPPHALHQPGNLAARRSNGLALKLSPDLAHAVDLEVGVPDPLHLGLQVCIAPRSGRQLARIGALRGVGMVGAWGDRQDPADQLDPMRLAVIVDERDHGLDRRAGPAIAKYADTLRRISLAWRSSRTSHSRALMRSRSSPLGPARRP